MKTYKSIIRHYTSHCRVNSQREIDWFKSQDINGIIHNSSHAIDECGRRYFHQRRITKKAIFRAENIIRNNWKLISESKDFENLHELLRKKLTYVFGLGDLYIYDTSFRIGAFLNLFPRQIYLHAGTKTGARKLGIEIRNRTKIYKSDLPIEFRVLEPHESEDILCIYKTSFELIRQHKTLKPNAGSKCCQ
jgi:hypothetical protein